MIHGPAYVAAMLKIAIAISGYNMPNAPLPILVELTHKQMTHEVCYGLSPCDVYGYYRDDDIVGVDPFQISHDGLTENEVVVHELTHWLQHHNGQGGFSCNQVEKRESQAYAVQNVYNMQYEHNFKLIKAPRLQC